MNKIDIEIIMKQSELKGVNSCIGALASMDLPFSVMQEIFTLQGKLLDENITLYKQAIGVINNELQFLREVLKWQMRK